MEALWHGLPSILLPLVLDQSTEANNLARLGCSINVASCETDHPISDSLQRAHNTYAALQARARQLGKVMRRHARTDAVGALDEILAAIRSAPAVAGPSRR